MYEVRLKEMRNLQVACLLFGIGRLLEKVQVKDEAHRLFTDALFLSPISLLLLPGYRQPLLSGAIPSAQGPWSC